MKIDKIESFLLKTLYVVAAGIILMQTLNINAMVSVLFYSIFPLTIALWLLALRNKPTKMDFFVLFIVILAAANVYINLNIMGGTLSFSYIKKIIFFCTTMFFFQIANRRKINKEESKFICQTMDAATLILIIMYFLQGSYRNEINDIISGFLSFRFSNPNLVGMFITCLIMMQLSRLLSDEGKKSKRTHLIYVLFLFFFIIGTKSRNCQLILIVYMMVYLWLVVSEKTEFFIPKKIASFIGAFPLLFSSIYMLIIESSIIQTVFGFMQSEGKGLDSRLEVWSLAFKSFFQSPIFGAYYQISDGTGASQMHNTLLDVGASFGGIVLILVILFLISLLYKRNRVFTDKMQFSYLLGFAAVLLLGMGEAAMFSGGLGIYIFMGTFLLMANGEKADFSVPEPKIEEIEAISSNLNIVFLSSYYNHHQDSLSRALAKQAKSFYFVETEEISEERLKLGWGEDIRPDYIKHWKKEQSQVEQALTRADIIIAGEAPEELIKRCVKMGKIVFRYSERPLKKGLEPLKYIPRLFKWHMLYPFWKPVYLLSASAYAAGDYAKFGLFLDHSYKWGYFPAVKQYDDVEAVMANKGHSEILWCGRFLELKHPDDVLNMAERLRNDGFDFKINFIGRGELEEQLHRQVKEKKLEKYINFLGTMKPEQVRVYMEKAGIFLFTSDKREGWGAVVNESMNSGCAVVASHEIGSVPFLIKNEQNGLIYQSGNVDDLYEKVRYLLEHPEEQQRLGEEAYKTIINGWNAETAARRLIDISANIIAGMKEPDLYKDGPGSKDMMYLDKLYKKFKIHTVKKIIVEFLVNHIFAGAHFFEIKRSLLLSIGYEIGENTKIVGPIICTGALTIGKDCWIGRDFKVHGNGTVEIGNRCDIAPEVTFLTGGHEIGDASRRAGKGESYDIHVGDGTWIGARATIGRTVTIGSGCVVAASACVMKNVKDNTMVGGVPAKMIRELDNES